MKRTNTFAARPLTDDDEQVLRDLLDASAALWNEINYQRLMRYNDEDGFEGDVWDADTGALEGKYKAVLGASTAQTVRRANSEAWRAFFENKNAYHDDSNTSITEHPEPPGFRGNEDDGRVLKGVVRKDAYTDDNLKPGAVAPFNGVCVLSDDAFENTSVILVVEANLRFADRWKSSISKTTESRWFRVFRDRGIRLVVKLLFVLEERAPRFAVCSPDSLGSGRAENIFVFSFESTGIGVPHVALEAVLVVVAHEALVVYLVPESGTRVQQVP